MPNVPQLTPEAIAKLTPRRRAILKLRFGGLGLREEEMAWVLADKQTDALAVRPRSLEEVAALIGITPERIRQIVKTALGKAGTSRGEKRPA